VTATLPVAAGTMLQLNDGQGWPPGGGPASAPRSVVVARPARPLAAVAARPASAPPRLSLVLAGQVDAARTLRITGLSGWRRATTWKPCWAKADATPRNRLRVWPGTAVSTG
jgi:hypothetical protein